jgi:hypothetical protein
MQAHHVSTVLRRPAPGAWLLARDIDCGDGVVREYWTGEMRDDGQPKWSPWKCDAFHFKHPDQGYAAAATHRSLRNSREWKVVPR